MAPRRLAGDEFLSSRGEGTMTKCSATWLAAIGLLLPMTTMAQTLSTPGTDQAGSVSTSPLLKAKMPVAPDADSANADPAGRYDWRTSHDFHSALPSHDSRVQGNLTAEAKLLEMTPIETPLPYLTVASKGAENEFSSTYGSSSYDWSDLSEFNAKVAYAKSKIGAVNNGGVSAVDETPAADETNQGGGVARTGGFHGQEATGFSMANK